MANDKFKNWAKISAEQLKQAQPAPAPAPTPETIIQIGEALQKEVGERMAGVLQPMIDRTTSPEEQMFIVGGIVAFAIGVGLQAGMTEADLIVAVKNIVGQIPR